MGIKKRPDIANIPCVIQYNDKGITLSITTANNTVENILIDKSRISGSKNVIRTIISQDDFKDTSVNQADVQILATALVGSYGEILGTLINKSGLLNSSNGGAETYTSLNELHISYTNDDNEQRDLIIQIDIDPTGLIDLINGSIN